MTVEENRQEVGVGGKRRKKRNRGTCTEERGDYLTETLVPALKRGWVGVHFCTDWGGGEGGSYTVDVEWGFIEGGGECGFLYI